MIVSAETALGRQTATARRLVEASPSAPTVTALLETPRIGILHLDPARADPGGE